MTKYLIIALAVVFIIFLVRAHYEDRETEQRSREHAHCRACSKIDLIDTNTAEGFHDAVRATLHAEADHGALSKSRVRTLLNNSRDQIIRGAIMGALTGGAADALNNAVTWSLVGGIVTGCSDWLHL